MTFVQLVAPAGLRRVEAQETDQPVGMGGGVGGHFAVGHPQPGKARFSTENDRFPALLGPFVILVPPDREVHFHVSSGSFCLLLEVFREVVGIAEIMAVNVYEHVFDDITFLIWSIRSIISVTDERSL